MSAGPADVLARLRDALGSDAVIDDAQQVAEHSSDRSGLDGAPGALAIVRPADTEAVAAVLAIANETRTPVVPQGARTGLAGGANALPASLLLDLTRLDAILAIDTLERSATVQPGVTVAALQSAAARQGLFYPPDPASAEWATVGGSIATNAGGMRAIKYGVTRDSVRSLQAVLADGTIVRTRPATVKGVAGLDLTALLVGSEGTLAVITEATLALRPAPGPLAGVAATFADVPAALEAANAIGASGLLPVTLELLDGVSLDAIRAYADSHGLPEGAQAWLVAVTDADSGTAADIERFEAVFRAHGAVTTQRAEDPQALDGLLAARRLLHPALRAMYGSSLNGDVGVPRRRLAEFAGQLPAIGAAHGIGVSVGGHVGDGNLHPVLAYDADDAAQTRAAHDAYAEILALAQSLGGTVTGEHGIGLEKLDALAGELPDALRRIQLGIKAVFDPNGILNPGKKLG